MALGDERDRAAEELRVDRPIDLEERDDVVRRRERLHLVDEPERLLAERGEPGSVLAGCRLRRDRDELAARRLRRDAVRGRLLEEARDAHVEPELAPEHADRADDEERVAARVEERLVRLDALDALRERQDLRDPLGERFPGRRGGRLVAILGHLRQQAPPVDLAVRADGQARDRAELRRDEVGGHLCAQPPEDVRAVGAGDGERHEPRPLLVARRRDGGRLDDGRVALDRRLDLGELDPVAPDLDLVVVAPAELVDAGHRVLPRLVARAVQPPLRRLDELPRGQRVVAQVAVRDRDPADDELALRSGRHVVSVLVPDAHGHAVDRPADRRRERPGARVLGQRVRGRDVSLGGAVLIDERAARMGREEHPELVGDDQPLAGRDHLTERRDDDAQLDGDARERAKSHVREEQAPDPLGIEPPQERLGIAAKLVVRDDELAPGRPGREDLLEEDVEAERRSQRGPVVASRRAVRDLPLHEVRGRAVRHHDRLRRPRRPGGEDDVGRIAGQHLGPRGRACPARAEPP